MPLKTTLGALVAAVAFSASILVATTSCDAAPTSQKVFERSVHGTYQKIPQTLRIRPPVIAAKGSANTPGGYLVRRTVARYRALAKWRTLAGKYYGPGATRWTLARNKSVICAAMNEAVTCAVSAKPANLLQRLGLMTE